MKKRVRTSYGRNSFIDEKGEEKKKQEGGSGDL